MTIVSALSPLSLTQFFYQSGKLVRPARLFFYRPGTEDRVTVYSDAGLGSSYDQPVLSGGSGRVPPIYVGTEPYRVRVFDSYGALIEDIDYLPGAISVTGGGSTGSVLTDAEKQQLLQTGDYVIQFANGGSRLGFVRANGGLIGPGGFTGTGFPDIERKNDDCYALFKHLWGQDAIAPNHVLEVLPSKGADADSDWFSLAKLIRLPDLRGRTLLGLDGATVSVGAPPNRLTGVAISPATGSLSKPGSYGGTATATMTAAQLAAHSHAINSSPTGIYLSASPTGVYNAYAPTGIWNSTAVANLAAAATGVYNAYTPTGIWIATAPTSIGVLNAPSGTYLVDNGHSHTVNEQALTVTGFGAALPGGGTTQFASLTTSHNTTGAYIADPQHYHNLNDPWHTHSVNDPWHTHAITDPTHNHTQTGHDHAINDPWHSHVITDPTHGHVVNDPTHTHTLASTGSSQALPTVSPFSLATVYIKL